MTPNNKEEQMEEIAALQAIFPDEIQVHEQETTFAVLVDLPVVLTTPLQIQFASSTTHTISYLPPLQISFQLPAGYPSEAPPIVRLSAQHSWIPDSVIKRLGVDMVQLWEDSGCSPALFSYISHVQEASTSAFGLLDGTLSAMVGMDRTLQTALLAYNQFAAQQQFEKETFLCGICLEPRKGDVCHRMDRCAHVFCVQCLQDFYSSGIQEGNIQTVSCLEPGCGKERKKPCLLSSEELLRIPISRAVVQRYVDLRRKRMLEADPETVWCPRKWCPGTAKGRRGVEAVGDDASLWDDIDEPADNRRSEEPPLSQRQSAEPKPPDCLAVCTTCAFAFCRVCLSSWHGPFITCISPHEREMLSRDNLKSTEYIRLSCARCPGCTLPCERISGCSHMTCPTCTANFCYYCSGRLDAGWHVDTNGNCVRGNVVGFVARPMVREASKTLMRNPNRVVA